MASNKDTIEHIYRSVRSTTAFLSRHGCAPCKGHYGSGYHYHSGFFTSPKGLLWYWASSDDRLGNYMLFRRARHLKDYTGETNQYPKSADDFDRMIDWHDRFEQTEMELNKSEETAKVA